MRVLIIEDEAPAFRRLQKSLEEVAPDIQILDVLDSVEASVKWLRNHENPDLIFMDIQLSDGISFQIFDEIAITVPVIFTTAFDEYSLQAFKVNSIDYLLKPIKNEDLKGSLDKLKRLASSHSFNSEAFQKIIQQIHIRSQVYKDRFLVKRGEHFVSVSIDEIAFFKTRHGVVSLFTKAKKQFSLNYTLDELQKLLDPQHFFRANRQFIVHYSAIDRVQKYHKGKLYVDLTEGLEEDIVISAERASLFKQWLGS
ncbi:MAG: LytTR family DNA-binding domain-containing protein [Saprospiraceae bacterium]|nr:LytTR family DNA-binding domain-containing protein [Saprospiraceae bacterium]